MIICHKLVAWKRAAVVQACHMSDVHTRLAVSSLPASRKVCAGDHLIQSYLSLLVSQTPSLGSDASPPLPLHEAVVAPIKTAWMQTE